MALTAKDKEHWKNRISSRIDRAIAEIYRLEGAQKRIEIQQKARERVLDSFAIQDRVERLETLREQIDHLKKLQDQVERELKNELKGRGFKIDYLSDGYRSIDHFIEAQAVLFECEVLLNSEFGRAIVRLLDEQEQLLDTVWLATSPDQIKRLWQEMATLLGQLPTGLQQQALACDPDSSTE